MAELDTQGVSVQRGVCGGDRCAACLAEVSVELERMLALPQTMAERARPSDRHFLPFATTRGFALAQAPEHRRDVLLPISAEVDAVLRDALSGQTGAVLADALGREAELCGLSAITSEPGSAVQAMHSDAEWSDPPPPRHVVMFIALHDILERDMGPTLFCAQTHAPRCFPGGRWLSPNNTRVAERGGASWFDLAAGDAALMDALTWHCGGANTSNRRRTLLCASFVEVGAVQARPRLETAWFQTLNLINDIHAFNFEPRC